MMKKKFDSLSVPFGLMVLLAAGLLSGCQKYEDGPWLSFRTRKERVVNSWRYNSALLNGFDIARGTDSSSFFYGFSRSGMGFAPDGRFSQVLFYTDTTLAPFKQTGNWSFQKRDEELLLEFDNGTTVVWRVLRLQEKKLWVEQREGANVMEFRLVPSAPPKRGWF